LSRANEPTSQIDRCYIPKRTIAFGRSCLFAKTMRTASRSSSCRRQYGEMFKFDTEMSRNEGKEIL
jgi:hypothetical protein